VKTSPIGDKLTKWMNERKPIILGNRFLVLILVLSLALTLMVNNSIVSYGSGILFGFILGAMAVQRLHGDFLEI
jgi:hypothetical protein